MNRDFWIVLAGFCIYFALLLLEQYRAVKHRRKLLHVIHVNGTRGKSTVTRMIDGGLRAGGYRVMTKTTGTVPMVIGVDGVESRLPRRGRASIREQLRLLDMAAKSGAQVLVLECMAVAPENQSVSQHRMLHADIGVITNVRMDHTDVMGTTLEDICYALTNTVPKHVLLFTAEEHFFHLLEDKAAKLGSRATLCKAEDVTLDLPFRENAAIALAVCQTLEVPKDAALQGILNYLPDPYTFSLTPVGTQGSCFANAMSANDPESTMVALQNAREMAPHCTQDSIILNNRDDRPFRTQQMLEFVCTVSPPPCEIYLLGAHQRYLARQLKKRLASTEVICCRSIGDIPMDQRPNTLFFAAGNIHGSGFMLMEQVKSYGA